MTTMNRWDPFQDALTLREAVNQLFEDSFVAPNTTGQSRQFVPALDLSETADAYIVEFAVPGVKAEDLDITVDNNILTVRGESRPPVVEENARNYHRIERRYGSFQRTLGLPSTVKSDAIKAELSDGVLYLEIPKAEEVKPRKISVAVN